MAVFASHRPSERSFGGLLREVTSDIAALFRAEVALAKAEISEKSNRVGRNLAALAVGAGICFAGALALLAAAINVVAWLIAEVISPALAVWLAPLLVGAVLAAVGYGRIRSAVKELKSESLAPEQTTQTLQENKEWLKEKIQ